MFHICDPPTSGPSQYNEHHMICYTRQHEGMGASYRPFGIDRSSSLGRNELMKHVLVFSLRRPLVRLGPIFRYIKTIGGSETKVMFLLETLVAWSILHRRDSFTPRSKPSRNPEGGIRPLSGDTSLCSLWPRFENISGFQNRCNIHQRSQCRCNDTITNTEGGTRAMYGNVCYEYPPPPFHDLVTLAAETDNRRCI